MSDRPSSNLGGLELDLSREIDAVCRRFEAAWREGRQPRIDDYLVDVLDEGRPALRAELSALERELRQSEETRPRPEAGSATTPEPLPAPPPSTVADAPTLAPGTPPTSLLPGAATTDIRDDVTVLPCEGATVEHVPAESAQLDAAAPVRVRYFGDYELINEIARGGMGVVFRARQVSLNRPVALKMILAGQLANEIDVKRFYIEAEAAANLDHPGIVPIYEVGQHEGQHYFSMGFVEGQSLAQRLADGPLASRQAAALLVKVAEAIEYAHRHGVVHRDLKPGNILLDRTGNPRVSDFGLAKNIEGDSSLSASGQVMGTPSYMPPEQAGGNRGAVGPPADVYALGATLYCAVTGRPPFQAASVMDTLLQVLSADPVPPRSLNPAVERDIETICLKCLEKDPARRYISAAALAEDLRRYLDGEPIRARPVTGWERAIKWARRRPAIAGLAAALMLATVLGIAGIAWQWLKAEANFVQAETNLAEANRQRGIAQEKSHEAIEKARILEGQLYINRVALAQREWMSNNSAAAGAILDRCPPQLRDWEWSYIRRLCHLHNLTILGFAETDRAGKLGQRARSGLASSPDGRRIASDDPERQVKVWDTMQGDLARDLMLTLRGMSGLAFSTDGRRVASADPEHLVKVWDTIRGDLVLTLAGHSDKVFAIAFSPDGHLLATGSQDKTIKLWDAATGTLVRTLEPHGSWIRSVAFSPDGTRIVSGSGAELFTSGKTTELILWEVATGRELRRFAGPHDRIYGVAYRPDGKQIASINCEASLKLWDPETGALQHRLAGHTFYIECVAYSPDGRTLATGGRDRVAILWDVATGRLLHTLRGHSRRILALDFSPDGKTLVTGDEDAEIKVWEVSGGAEITHFRDSNRVTAIRFSPDGRFLGTAGGDNLVKIWETAALSSVECRTLGGHNGWCSRAAYTPDGRTLATTGWGIVRLWDATSGRPIRNIATGVLPGVWDIAFQTDGQAIATAQGRGRNVVDLWEVATGRRLRVFEGHRSDVKCVAFSPDGRTLASGSADHTVRLWNASAGHQFALLEGHTGEVESLAFSPDGKLLASQGLDSTVRLWDAATGRTIRVHEAVPHRYSDRNANGLTFSPDSRRLAAPRSDARISVWDVKSGAEVLELSHDGRPFNAVAYLSERRIISTDDRVVKVWDAETGEPVLTLRKHDNEVIGLACRPDGTQFTTTGADQTARVWETVVPSPEERRKARISGRVESLYERHRNKDRVAEDLRADRSWSEPDRAAAVRLAQALPEDPTLLTMPDDPTLLNNTSWSIVVNPHRTPEEYRRGLRYAEAACRLAPQESTFVNTLGVARYRAGQYREALDELNRSLKLNAPRFAGPIPADLGFIAMAQHRLGQAADAQKTLEQFRDVMRKKPWSEDAESKAFWPKRPP